jgi:hypothetical protein
VGLAVLAPTGKGDGILSAPSLQIFEAHARGVSKGVGGAGTNRQR